MPTFSYICKDQNAQTVTGKIDASELGLVVDELRRRQLVIISIDEVKAAVSFLTAKGPSLSGHTVKTEDVILFARQMATMVDAGIPILQTMEALEEQASNLSFKKILAGIHEDIRLGSSLSGAFTKYPRVFNNLFVNMIKVGETAGVLTTVLDRVASYMEKSERLRRKVTGAMIYPAVISSMAIVIVIVLMVFVVPTFKTIYGSMGQALPPMTRVLMSFSEGFQKLFLYGLVGGVACVILFVNYARTASGSMQIDYMKLRFPLFGDLVCKVAVSRFCRTLAVLVQSGVPILEGLDIVRKTIGNRVLEKVVEDVIKCVREGASIAEPLQRSRVFPVMVTRMIAIGEQSGQLDKMMLKVSDFYDEQVDAVLENMTRLIEPLIIGFLGIVIGFIVIALFMPIMNMAQMVK